MFLSNKSFDYASAELIGLYIENYTVFHKEFISLHPLIDVEKKRETINLKKTKPMDPFLESSLNVKIIVGDNGTGKSTIINLLSKSNENAITIFKDNNDNFASTKEFLFHYNSKKISCHIKDIFTFSTNGKFPSNTDLIQGFFRPDYPNDALYDYLSDSEKKNNQLAYYYSQNSKIFDFSKDNTLFSNFEIHPIDYMDQIAAVIPYGFQYDLIDSIDTLFIDSPLDALCACSIFRNAPYIFGQSSVFDDTKKKKITFKQLILKFRGIKKELDWPKYNQLSRKLKKFIIQKDKGNNPVLKAYSFKEYKTILSEMNHLKPEITNWFSKAKIKLATPTFYYFRPYKLINGTRRYFNNLSSGEATSITNKLYFYPLYKNLSEKNSYFLLLDEPDKSYHPKWSRCFWQNLIKANDFIKKAERRSKVNRNLSIIVTTHSPFLLSDAFPNNLIRLRSNKEGTQSTATKMDSTFAGNIGEMYYTRSFMESTIGSLAEAKIKEWISIIQNKETPQSVLIEIKEKIENIGDEILRDLLLNKIKYRDLV